MAIVLNGSTGIQNVLGSASSPAESNTSSSNTGLYFPSSTTLGLSTAGTNALYIDASQNVGIGTTSPGALLEISKSNPAGYVAQFVTNTSSTGYAETVYNIGASGANGQAAINYAPGTFFALGPTTNDTTTPIVFRNNNATERMRIDTSGNLLVGKTSGSGNKVEVPGAGIAGQGTTNVSTSATTIFTISQTSTGAFIVVYGDDGSNGFMDILFFLANQTSQVISSKTMYGSPAARTYTTSTAALRAALASGSLNFRVAAISTLGT